MVTHLSSRMQASPVFAVPAAVSRPTHIVGSPSMVSSMEMAQSCAASDFLDAAQDVRDIVSWMWAEASKPVCDYDYLPVVEFEEVCWTLWEAIESNALTEKRLVAQQSYRRYLTSVPWRKMGFVDESYLAFCRALLAEELSARIDESTFETIRRTFYARARSVQVA